jgi:hypothetical protein
MPETRTVSEPAGDSTPAGEFRQPKPSKAWPEEVRSLIRFYVAAKGERLDPCPACGAKKRGRWTMLCPFASHGFGVTTLKKLGEHAPLTLVCSDHPISPTEAIRAALDVRG